MTFICGPEPGVTITITSTKTIAQDTTLDGSGGITLSAANGSVPVFEVNQGVNFVVRNLTIAGGGFGIRYESSGGGTLTVTHSTFTGNVRGIVFIGDGTLTVANTTFTGTGGGVVTLGDGAVTVLDSTFADNKPRGGAAALTTMAAC